MYSDLIIQPNMDHRRLSIRAGVDSLRSKAVETPYSMTPIPQIFRYSTVLKYNGGLIRTAPYVSPWESLKESFG